MSLTRSFTVGDLTCHTLEGGIQRLDGGAMFGVVPKPLWERRIVPDSRNRIPLAMRCLLIEHPEGPVLIDTGLGNKENDKFTTIYGVENAGRTGPTQLEDALAELEVAAADVRMVINTHLHFDHAGGNTFITPDDPTPRLAFPNATYVVQREELTFARQHNERIAASYLPRNFEPVAQDSRWRLVEGDEEIVPGIRVIRTPGHVPHHQSVLITAQGATACFFADLVPTTAHLPLPWIMGYDVEPLVTLETKRALLARAHEERWMVVFEHDPTHGVGYVGHNGKAYEFEEAE